MLSPGTIRKIRSLAQKYWETEVTKPYFQEIAQGKEVGHRIADLIDEKTCAVLTAEFLTKHEHHMKGERKPRSMGDVWLDDAGVYHPINVKAGLVGSEGQPNLVSLKKVLNAILARWIDSYYLLIVKIKIAPQITPSVYLIDMLDYLDYVTFDSGPGQMMLKAKAFFTAYDPKTTINPRPLREKVERLVELLEDGERRLRANRDKSLKQIQNSVQQYLAGGQFAVTPETQQGLNLQ